MALGPSTDEQLGAGREPLAAQLMRLSCGLRPRGRVGTASWAVGGLGCGVRLEGRGRAWGELCPGHVLGAPGLHLP